MEMFKPTHRLTTENLTPKSSILIDIKSWLNSIEKLTIRRSQQTAWSERQRWEIKNASSLLVSLVKYPIGVNASRIPNYRVMKSEGARLRARIEPRDIEERKDILLFYFHFRMKRLKIAERQKRWSSNESSISGWPTQGDVLRWRNRQQNATAPSSWLAELFAIARVWCNRKVDARKNRSFIYFGADISQPFSFNFISNRISFRYKVFSKLK